MKGVLVSLFFVLSSSFLRGQSDCYKTVSNADWDLKLCINENWVVDFQPEHKIKIRIGQAEYVTIKIETLNRKGSDGEIWNDLFGYIDTSYYSLISQSQNLNSSFKVYKSLDNEVYYLRGFLSSESFGYKVFFDANTFEEAQKIIQELTARISFIDEKKLINNTDTNLASFRALLVKALEKPKLIEDIWICEDTFTDAIPLEVKRALFEGKQVRIAKEFDRLIDLASNNYDYYKLDVIDKHSFSNGENVLVGLLVLKDKHSLKRIYVDVTIMQSNGNYYLSEIGEINVLGQDYI